MLINRNFRHLNNEERKSLKKTCERRNLNLNLNRLYVRYGIDENKLFTYCEVKDFTSGRTYIGAAKRNKTEKDKHNESIAKTIALHRAIKE